MQNNMIICTVRLNNNKPREKTVMAVCPHCGQKLTEVVDGEGSFSLRIKCRRCRNFIDVDISQVY